MGIVDVDAIEKCVQDLRGIIKDNFEQRVSTAKANLDSLESELSNSRNYHQAGVVADLSAALTRLQGQCSKKNQISVIEKIEHIQRLCEDPNNRKGWHLPKREWPMDLDLALQSVSLCTNLVELLESAEALLELGRKVVIDSERLLNNG